MHASEQGQTQRANGHLRAARESFVLCAQDACAIALRRECMRWLDDVDTDTPSVVLAAKDPSGRDLTDVTVHIDGQPTAYATSWRSVALDPGPHEVRFEREGSPPIVEKLVLRMGERNRSVVATFSLVPRPEPVPSPPTPPPSPSPWMIGFAALAATGFASFGYFGVSGLEEKSRLRSSCAPTCTDDQLSDLKKLYITADVSLAVGSVSLLTAAYLYLSSRSHGAASAQSGATGTTSWGVDIALNAARFRLTF